MGWPTDADIERERISQAEREIHMSEQSFSEWESRLEAWLASLPADDPIHRLDDIEKCKAFAKLDER